MTAAEVGEHVCRSFERFSADGPSPLRWEDLRGCLLAWVAGLPPDEAFDGLMWILQHRGRYQEQWLAGDLLCRASLSCPLGPADFLERVTPNLDASADTVAQYAVQAFGRDAVLATLSNLLTSSSDAKRVATVNNLRYWLGVRPAATA